MLVNRFRFLSLYLFNVLLFSGACSGMANAVADTESCSNIRCDCHVLVADWQAACQQVESQLVSDCEINQGQPAGYCTIHGPRANYLPLVSSRHTIVSVDRFSDIHDASPEVLMERLESIVWSMESDINASKRAIDDANYQEAALLLKQAIFSTKLFTKVILPLEKTYPLHEKKKLLAVNFLQKKNTHKALKIFINETMKPWAQEISDYTYWVWSLRAAVTSEVAKREIQKLAFLAMRISGASHEFLGIAHRYAGKFSESAQAWEQAAIIAQLAASRSEAYVMNKKVAEFFRMRAAAAFQRSAYFLMQLKKRREALASLQRSLPMLSPTDTSIDSILRPNSGREYEAAAQ